MCLILSAPDIIEGVCARFTGWYHNFLAIRRRGVGHIRNVEMGYVWGDRPRGLREGFAVRVHLRHAFFSQSPMLRTSVAVEVRLSCSPQCFLL